jgi:hypothetical protein
LIGAVLVRYLDFNLVPLLGLFHFPVLVTELCTTVIQLLLGDLPKGVDLILELN